MQVSAPYAVMVSIAVALPAATQTTATPGSITPAGVVTLGTSTTATVTPFGTTTTSAQPPGTTAAISGSGSSAGGAGSGFGAVRLAPVQRGGKRGISTAGDGERWRVKRLHRSDFKRG